MKIILGLIASIVVVSLRVQPAPPAIPMHDPVIIRQDGIYYVFATGPGISIVIGRSN